MTRSADYRKEFPDFPAADMPTLPAGFYDSSWCNDMSPSFYSQPLQVCLWIDYADPDKREFPETERFTLHAETRDHSGVIQNAGIADGHLVSTDSWVEVEAHLIARAFTNGLKDDMTPKQWREMRIRNISYPDKVCASHDFRDANVYMDEAFKAVTGREAAGSYETHYDAAAGTHVADDPAEEAAAIRDAALWSRAWAIAKALYLTETACPVVPVAA